MARGGNMGVWSCLCFLDPGLEDPGVLLDQEQEVPSCSEQLELRKQGQCRPQSHANLQNSVSASGFKHLQRVWLVKVSAPELFDFSSPFHAIELWGNLIIPA